MNIKLINFIPNIVWLIPDGVRIVNYIDPIGRFKCFENLKQEGFVEFTNMYTAAPSTFMSFISFLTGIYVTKLGDKYGEIKTLKYEIPTIKDIFQQLGINNYFFTFHPDLKAQLNTLDTKKLVKDKKSFLKGHANYGNISMDISYIKKIILNGLKEPFCLFIHLISESFDDPEKTFYYDFNKIFFELYNLIKNNINVDKTIFIIHSDHGYPIYKGGTDFQYMIFHDELLCQSNIKVPFFIRIPFLKKFSEIEKIDIPCSLVDIVPTLSEIYGFKLNEFIDGISLFKAIKEDFRNRVIRVDNRFPAQKNLKIALIKNNKKIIYDRDNNKFNLYEIGDGIEENEIEISENWINFFNKENNNFEIQKRILNQKIKELKISRLKKLLKSNKKLFIKCEENEFIQKFLEENNIEAINIENVKYKDLISINLVCFIFKNIFIINPYEFENKFPIFYNFKNVKYVMIDAYTNIHYIEEDLEIFFNDRFQIYKEKIKRKNRRKNDNELANDYFEFWIKECKKMYE